MKKLLLSILFIIGCDEAGLNTNSITNCTALTDTLYISHDTTFYVYDTLYISHDTTFYVYDTLIIKDTLIIYNQDIELCLITTINSPPSIPDDLKITCYDGPDSPSGANSSDCPVLVCGENQYWGFSHIDNRGAMTIVGFNSSGEVTTSLYREGARYLWDITLSNDQENSIVFWGQGSDSIIVSLNELTNP